MKTVVLLGKGSLAIQAAQWLMQSPNHDLAFVVPVIPEPTWTDSLASWCETNKVPVVVSGRVADLPASAQFQIDLAISIFYDKILKAEFLDRCTRATNLHNGPLPKYRGVSPINWALKNGETEHGVTIHEITPGVDDGAIIAQAKYSIYPEIDEVQDVYERSLHFAWPLFTQTIPRLDQIEPVLRVVLARCPSSTIRHFQALNLPKSAE